MRAYPTIGDYSRKRVVKGKFHVYNVQNEKWTKKDAQAGRVMDQKADNEPFKGVRKEKP